MASTVTSQPQELAYAWLRACLCANYNSTAIQRARAIQTDAAFDWDVTFAMALAEFVEPMVYEMARENSLLPPNVAPQWHSAQLQYAKRNLYLLHELENCLDALSQANIPVITLKGAALASVLYKNPMLRPMRDLDLLIDATDVERAQTVLETLDYVPMKPELHTGAFVQYENEIALLKQTSAPLALEVHWNLIDSPYYQARVQMEWFWKTTRELKSKGTTRRVLGKEAQFLYACAHLWLHHRGDELLWLNDLRMMLQADASQLEWAELFARAEEFSWTLPLQQTLLHLREEWDAELPLATREWLKGTQPSAHEAKQIVRVRERASVGRRFWHDLATLPSWNQRANFALVNLFPSRAYMRQRYALQNPLLLGLAYPYRWWRGAVSFWRN